MLGREDLVASFRQVVRRGRLGQAYLFTGPPGIGKRLFAVEFARALLCERSEPGDLEPCGDCAACQQVTAGTHPDFFFTERPEDKHELPMALMQDLCQALAMKPARGQRKVAVVDDAEDFNEESANCFLKTLEEPPPHSLLMLIAPSAERLLPTIVSRCQVVPFRPLTQSSVREILQAQGIKDEVLLRRVLRLCEGSPGQAQELTDPALWEFRSVLLNGICATPFDAVSLARDWKQFIEAAGKETAAHRQRAALTLRFLVDFLSLAISTQFDSVDDADDRQEHELLKTFVLNRNEDQLLRLLDRCLLADNQITRRVQLILIIEALCDAFAQELN